MKYFRLQRLNLVLKYNHGFAVFDIVIALALFVLILSLNFSVASYLKRIVCRVELDRIAITCQYLQQRARIEEKAQELTFDIAHNSYTHDHITHQLPGSITFGVLPDLLGPPSVPTHTILSPITFKNHVITFHPDGVIQPGTIYLLDTSNKTQYALSCAVAEVSYLRKYCYDNTWKLI